MENICLLDTNIFVYALNKDSEFHTNCKKIINDALYGKIKAAVADKSLYEFFAIITDNRRIEKPIKPSQAISIIELIIESEIEILYSSKNTIFRTLELANKYNVKKQYIFDYVLAGIMLSNGITDIYTYNKKDFLKIKEIQ